MIDAYLDESGIHDGAQACVIAGYFGGRGQWKRVERAWEETLKRFNVPTEKFHATDMVKCRGFFHGWSAEKSLELQTGLANAVAAHKIYPVAQGVLVSDFHKFSLVERRFLTGATLRPDGRIKESGNASKPYFAPFQQVIKRVLSYAPVGGKGHFFFGVDRPSGKYAEALYATLKGNPDHPYADRFGQIGFPLAKETPALQAADFLTYLVYHDMLTGEKIKSWQAVSPVVRTLLRNIRDRADLCYQDEQCIRETLRTIPIEQRGDLLADDLAE
jgi:hypothetical protein